MEKYSISDKGRIRNDRTGYILQPFIKGRKVMVTLNLMDKKVIQIGVPTMVAKTFVGNHVKKVVRIDKDYFNNSLENLKIY